MTREEELYKLYEQGFEKVLALLLQKQKMGKYDKYEKIILFEINKILNQIERETLSYSKKDMPTLYEWNGSLNESREDIKDTIDAIMKETRLAGELLGSSAGSGILTGEALFRKMTATLAELGTKKCWW